jgi:hypothetical protein
MTTRLTISIAVTLAVALAAVPASANPKYVQLGMGTSTAMGATPAVRTQMTQPALGPNYPSGDPYRFYWIGTTFYDGIFFQAGYADQPLDSQCAALNWFVYAQDSLGNRIQYVFGGCGTTGTKYYTLYDAGYDFQDSAYYYSAQIGSTNIGYYVYSAYSTFSVSQSGPISEVSSSVGFPPGSPGLPRVTYNPAIQAKTSSGSFVNTVDGHVTRSNGGDYSTPCPPYEIDDGGTDAGPVYSTASPAHCYAQGTVLW